MKKDLNFFRPYQGIEKEKNSDKKLIQIIVGATALVITATLIYNSVNLYIVGNKIDSYNAKLNDSDFLTNLEAANTVIAKTNVLNEYDKSLSNIISAIESRDVVKTDILNSISSTMPSEVKVTSIIIKKEEIVMKVESTKISAIGELEHNLKELDYISSVSVGNIAGITVYTADLSCQLKDVE